MRWEIWLVQALALLGLLLANFDRLHLTGRLRQNVVAQQAIVKELPEGMARRELQEHIDRQVRLMVVEQEPATPSERNNNRWSAAFLLLGFLLLWTMLEGADVESRPAWYLVVTGLASVGLIVAGLYQNVRAGRSRQYRKWAGRMAVERGKPWDRESREAARAARVPESDRGSETLHLRDD